MNPIELGKVWDAGKWPRSVWLVRKRGAWIVYVTPSLYPATFQSLDALRVWLKNSGFRMPSDEELARLVVEGE